MIGRRSARGGFTLVEVLLVFALLTIVGAVLWPALDGPFAAEHLRGAAELLRADLVRARVLAVDSGTPHRMMLVVGTRHYAVYEAPYGSPTSPPPAPAGGAAGGVQAVAAPGDPASGVAPSLGPLGVPIIARSLPENVTLVNVELGLGETAGVPAMLGGPVDVMFQPDGTTTTAKFVLVNDRQMSVSLRLRGLTGGVTVDDVSGGGATLDMPPETLGDGS